MAKLPNENDTDYVSRMTREYFNSIFVEERLIDAQIPSQEFELYGEHFSTPIMTPAFSHLRTFVKELENGMQLAAGYRCLRTAFYEVEQNVKR